MPIGFPVPDGTEIATDTIGADPDQVDWPYGKIGDGTAGSEVTLAVTDHRGLHAESAMHGFFGTTSIGETTYGTNEIIGGPILFAVGGAGFYELFRASVILGDFGDSDFSTAMPDVMYAMLGVPAGTDVSAIADGVDVTTLPFNLTLGMEIIAGDRLVAHPLFPGMKNADPDKAIRLTLQGVGGGQDYSASSDLYGLVIAAAPIITDLTALSIGAAGSMRFVGDGSRN